MKYHSTLVIKKAAISVVESGMDLIVCNEEIELKENVYDFLEAHVKKILNDENSIRGRFTKQSKLTDPIMSALKDKLKFIELHKMLSEQLKEQIEEWDKAGDFILVEILVDMEKSYAMLFLEYEEVMIHTIDYEGELKVNLKSQTNMLPQKGKKLKRAAIVFNDGEITMTEKEEKDESKQMINFWIEGFLKARKSMKDEEHTRILYNAMEGYMRKNIKEDIKQAIEKREYLRLQYLNQDELIPEDIVKEIIEDQASREKMILAMQGIGLMTDRLFMVDKKWTQKKLKDKTMGTSNGFTLKANSELFKDKSRYEIIYEEDKTATIILKGIRNVSYT